MKTIVFVANDFDNFQHHRRHLAIMAADNGLVPILLADGGKKHVSECDYRRVKIERFSFHFFDIVLFYKILMVILFEKPVVLHLINLKPYLYGGLAAQFAKLLGWKGKIIITVPGRGRLFESNGGTLSALRRKIVTFILGFSVRGAKITFETESDRNFWIGLGLVPSESTIVTNGAGIDFSQFPHFKNEPPEQPLRVLYAGRLLRTKGLDVYLAAAALNNKPDIEMYVAGYIESDPDAVSHEELSSHSGIVFLGGVSDMGGLLARTDVVVLPSRYNEGIPRILIEAAACGCVPVATLFPGSEALMSEGETGFFLYEHSKLAQAEEILKTLEHLQKYRCALVKIGRAASDYVRNNDFSSEANSRRFNELYFS